MVADFPSSWLDNISLAVGSGVVACALSAVTPKQWGWMAFPLVLIGTVAATLSAAAIYLWHRYDGFIIAINPWQFLSELIIIGLAYWVTVVLRRPRRPSK